MFYCPDCGSEFSNALITHEKHGLDSPPFEKMLYCPNCKSQSIYEKNTTHCRCCGSKLRKGKKDYCSNECAKKGEKLWKLQINKRKNEASSPLNEIIREVISYNRKHNTKYSYGQYVALIKYNKKRKKSWLKKKSYI